MNIIAKIWNILWPGNIESDIALVILPCILLQPCNKLMYSIKFGYLKNIILFWRFYVCVFYMFILYPTEHLNVAFNDLC